MAEYFFRRYRNGRRMAEDVRITKATTLEEACASASRIAAQYKDGTTLVYEPDAQLRADLAARDALLHRARQWLPLQEGVDAELDDLIARIDAALGKAEGRVMTLNGALGMAFDARANTLSRDEGLAAFLASLRANGWVVVPGEPTPKMLEAGYNAMFAVKWDGSDAPMIGAGYDAMLAAAEGDSHD